VCARHGHELMGWKSPVGVTDSSHAARITTSRRQGQGREELSEGSWSAKVRADGQKLHRRLSLRASQHWMTKPTGTADRVNAAVVHRKRMFLLGEICPALRCKLLRRSQSGALAEQGPGVSGGCRPGRANETVNATLSAARRAARHARDRTGVSRGRISRERRKAQAVNGRT
jgi:hypothetical protein